MTRDNKHRKGSPGDRGKGASPRDPNAPTHHVSYVDPDTGGPVVDQAFGDVDVENRVASLASRGVRAVVTRIKR